MKVGYMNPESSWRWWQWGVYGWMALISFVIILWISVLLAGAPLRYSFTHTVPFPVACSRYGCVTTRAWAKYHQAQHMYATSAGRNLPQPADSLTTLIRSHLSEHMLLGTPISHAQAVKYREEILHVNDEAVIGEYTGLSARTYDELVILTFLQQEALQQQEKVDSRAELFAKIGPRVRVFVLPRGLKWHKDRAEVIES